MAGKMGFQMKKYTQMSDEIEQLDVDLTEHLKKIRADIEAIDWDTSKVNMPREQKEAEFKRIANELQNARSMHQNYRVEMRELARDELAVYEPKAKAHLNTIEELARTLTFAKTSQEKRELMGSRGEQKGPELDKMSAGQVIEEAKKIQGQDLEAVERMKRMVQDSESVGVETNIKLKSQTEQLKNIHVDVDTVNSNMTRADKLLNQIGKRMFTDKLIACLLLFIILGIFAIIIVKSLGLDSKDTIVGGSSIKIDCSLDITKTNKQCMEIAKKLMEAGSGN